MNPALAAAAFALVIGAVMAVSAREGRVAVLGLVIALVATPLVADPLPSVPALAIRLTAAILAAYLVRSALHGGPTVTLGSHLGWPVHVVQAATAAVIGYGIATAGTFAVAPSGPPDGALPTVVPLGLAAAAAVLVLAFEPIALARDGLRLGIGLLLALSAVSVAASAVLGQADALAQIVVAASTATIAAGTAVVCIGATAASGDLALSRIPSSLRTRRPGSDEPDEDEMGPR